MVNYEDRTICLRKEFYNLHFFLFAVIIAAAGIFLAWPIFDWPLFVDESYSVNIAMLPFSGILEQVAKDNHPPLYYLLLSIWIKIFGIGEVSVRMLSVLFYILGAFFIGKLSYIIYENKWGAFFTIVMYVFAQITISHMVSARMYSMLSVIVMMSFLLFIRSFLMQANDKFGYWFLFLINLVGVFTHYWFLFILLAQILFILMTCRDRVKHAVVSIVLPVILFAMA